METGKNPQRIPTLVMVFYYLFNIFSLFATVRIDAITPSTPTGVTNISIIGSIPTTSPSASAGHPAIASRVDIRIRVTPGIPGIAIIRTIDEKATEIIFDSVRSMP